MMRTRRKRDRFLPRRWPCPGCGVVKPVPVETPRPCKDCRLDADMLKLALDTLRRLPTRHEDGWQWLKGVMAARLASNGNGPCSHLGTPERPRSHSGVSRALESISRGSRS